MQDFILKKHDAPFVYADFWTHGPNKAVILPKQAQDAAVSFLREKGLFCALEFKEYDGQRMACKVSFFEFDGGKIQLDHDDQDETEWAFTPKMLADFEYSGSIYDGIKNIAPTLYDVICYLSMRLNIDSSINFAADCFGVCCDVKNFEQAQKEVAMFEQYHAEAMQAQANFRAYWGDKYAHNVELLAETFN